MVRTYYDILGVPETATAEEIKVAYRTAAMKWHPDRHEGVQAKAMAQKRFQEIHEAYRVLKDPEGRAEYDAYLRQSRQEARSASSNSTDGSQRTAGADTEFQQSGFAGSRADQTRDAGDTFFAEMVDLAFELKARGFNTERIAAALIGLGCPRSMAEAVAKLSASDRQRERQTATDRTPKAWKREIDKMDWPDARPYYQAFFGGADAPDPISDSEFERFRKKERNLHLGVLSAMAIGSMVFFLIRPIFSNINPIWLVGGIVLAIVSWIGMYFWSLPRAYRLAKAQRKYLNIFYVMHEGKGRPNFLWVGFLFSGFWLGYRKMLIYALAFGFWMSIADVFLYFAFDLPDEPRWLGFVWGMTVAAAGPYLYYRFARKKINKIIISSDSLGEAVRRLRKSGGTSGAYAILGFLIMLLPLMAAIALIENEQKIQIAHTEQLKQWELAEQKRKSEEESARQAQIERIKAERYEDFYNATVSRYPFLNDRSPEFDPAATKWVLDRVNFHIQTTGDKEQAFRLAIFDMEAELRKIRRNR